MNIQEIFEQLKNQPSDEWNLLWMVIENVFPCQQSIWSTWLSKIQEGEKNDYIYFKRIEDEVSKELNKVIKNEHDFDPGDYLNDIAIDIYTVTNNLYASLVVSIWSQIEKVLKEISLIVARQLCMDKNNKTDFGCQKDFYFKHLEISFSELSSYSEINAIRILNNSYKHSDCIYKVDDKKIHNNISTSIASKWKITDEIDYTILPIDELLLNARCFIEDLYSKARKQTMLRIKQNCQ